MKFNLDLIKKGKVFQTALSVHRFKYFMSLIKS